MSIRRNRFDAFVQRMGPWMHHMKRFPAVNGKTLDFALLRGSKQLADGLSEGQVGCYKSHENIWKAIAKSNFEQVTVLEDDVDIRYDNRETFLTKLAAGFRELEERQVEWDFLCWGHGGHTVGKNQEIFPPNSKEPLQYWRDPNQTCQGFFAYTIKKSLAEKLIQKSSIIMEAIDVWFFCDYVPKHNVKVLCFEPRLCFVVDGPSETTKMLE